MSVVDRREATREADASRSQTPPTAQAASRSNGAASVPAAAQADSIAVPSTLLDVTPQQAGTQTLLRGLAILEAAAAGVRDLRTFGAALGTTRSTTHRLVSSLVQARYRQIDAPDLDDAKAAVAQAVK